MKKEFIKKSEAVGIIFNLLLMIFAFGFILSLEMKVVSGVISEDGEEFLNNQAGDVLDYIEGETDEKPTITNIPTNEDTLPKVSLLKKLYMNPGEFEGGNAAWGVGQGLLWAGVAYFTIPIIGDLLGLEDSTVDALQYGVSAGLFTAGSIRGLAGAEKLGGFVGGHPFLIGAGVGAIVFVLTYKEVEYRTVNFNCMTWEAPIGGEDCEKCNDGIHQCSEYRCKSLGQACELENVGTEFERCYWKNPKDVTSPTIKPWEDILTEDYVYSTLTPRPPGGGTVIKKENSPCIAAFTPIEFGIVTNKIAQCKISLNSSTSYEEMEYYFGNSNLFGYNHSQKLSLPSPDNINDFAEANTEETGGLEIQNNGKYELYVRCKSANGYYNVDPYQIKFCVDEGPDTTPPQIVEFSVADNSPVQYEIDEFEITVYTNEPSTCKWSRDNDLNFDAMENTMSCATNLWDMNKNMLYACTGILTGIQDRTSNVYYFRCEDQPWMQKDERNQNTKGTKLTLIGTEPLNIDSDAIKPERGDIVKGATSTVEVNLELKTQNGYKDGDATCYYSRDNESFSEFKETGTHAHAQRQDLPGGIYNYYFKCVDAGGNAAYAETSFEVYIDTKAPVIVRVLYNADSLELITDEDAECYYSFNENTGCNFDIGNSSLANQMRHKSSDELTEHFATWDTETDYFVKCMDTNGKQPLPTQCSIIVRAVEEIE